MSERNVLWSAGTAAFPSCSTPTAGDSFIGSMREKYFDIQKANQEKDKVADTVFAFLTYMLSATALISSTHLKGICHRTDFHLLIPSGKFSPVSVFLFYTEKHYEIDPAAFFAKPT